MAVPRANLVLPHGAPAAPTRADAVTVGVPNAGAALASGAEAHLRVANPREGRLRADLEAALGEGVAAVLLACARLPQDLRDADVELRRQELRLGLTPGRIALIPEIASAAALARLPALLAAADRVACAAVDFESLAGDLGAPDATAVAVQEPLLARVAVEAAAAGLPWTVGAPGFAAGDRARLAARARALGAGGVYAARESEVAGLRALFADADRPPTR